MLSLAAMVACQVLSGISPEPVRYTGLIVALLAVASVGFAAGVWGWPRAVAAFGAVVLVGYLAEWVGVVTGLPFGSYSYTGLLWPQLAGVPVVVALAWGGMGLAGYAVARAVAPGGGWRRVAVGALALTAWDLFLDPQMVGQGLWVWAEDGFYRGVPLSNFAGWLLVSALVMLVIQRIVGAAPPEEIVSTAGRGRAAGTRPAGGRIVDAAPLGRGLIVVYTTMAVMETIGFAAVFDPPDPLVAVTGGIAMGAFAALAWRRTWQR